MKKHLLYVLAFCSVLSPAFAQDKASDSVVRVATPNGEDVPVLKKIGDLAGEKAHVEYDYLGTKYGADVWLLSGEKVMEMIQVLPSGAAIMGGTFVSPEGEDVGQAIQKDFAAQNPARAQKILERVRASLNKDGAPPPPDQANEPATTAPAAEKSKTPDAAATAEMIWSHMDKLGLVRYGAEKDAPIVYLVIDPTQEPSVEAFKKLEPFADAKKIDLRVVPITLTSEKALMDIAMILPDKTSPQELKDLMAGKHPLSKAPPNPDGGLLLKNTADFVEAMRLNTLPSLFYRPSATGPIRAVKGMPKDWDPILKELGIE